MAVSASRSSFAAAAVAALMLALALRVLSAGAQEPSQWIEPGRGGTLPAEQDVTTPEGTVGLLNANGPIEMKGHPFFEPLGTNGRACVTCHQPAYAMSISAASVRKRWRDTDGRDPIFAPIDGSNCPNLPQGDAASHSLLLTRGLIRVFLPWPPKASAGAALKPEFHIEVVHDPTGCNSDPVWGLRGPTPMVSVFRRPRPAANLKFVAREGQLVNIKTGEPSDVDPDTGRPVAMNILSDAREPTLKTQAISAASQHLQAAAAPSADTVARIVNFERQVYAAISVDAAGGRLVESGGPAALGPRAMLNGVPGTLGDKTYAPVFGFFEPWKSAATPAAGSREAFRASVARGADIFMLRPFWIKDATHINTIGLGNPVKRTCATCHNATLTGQDVAPGWVDLGTTNYPTWTEPGVWSRDSELPVFKITCDGTAPPHPFLGRVIYTTDPGRALITGRCADVGSIVMQQFRGLAVRAPYFANGSARTLRELVDFYDRRFDMKLSEEEKQDLVNFMRVL